MNSGLDPIGTMECSQGARTISQNQLVLVSDHNLIHVMEG